MTAPVSPTAWRVHLPALRGWFALYLLLWAPTLFLIFTGPPGDASTHVVVLIWATIAAYVGTIVYSYRTQRDLHAAGLYKYRPWQVVAGAILLNPLFFGPLIPTSVLWTAYRVARRRAGNQEGSGTLMARWLALGDNVENALLARARGLMAALRSHGGRMQLPKVSLGGAWFLLATVALLTTAYMLRYERFAVEGSIAVWDRWAHRVCVVAPSPRCLASVHAAP